MGIFSRSNKHSGGVAVGVPQQPFHTAAAYGIASPYPLGHAPPHVRQQATMLMKGVMRDLSNVKRIGVMAPQHMVIENWLQALGRALEPMTIIGGPAKGMRDWMTEVQILITKIKERVFARCIPLNGSEKQAIAAHANHWLGSRGGGCDTSQPHVQIVILALSELSRY